jgi:hypothetical protein
MLTNHTMQTPGNHSQGKVWSSASLLLAQDIGKLHALQYPRQSVCESALLCRKIESKHSTATSWTQHNQHLHPKWELP